MEICVLIQEYLIINLRTRPLMSVLKIVLLSALFLLMFFHISCVDEKVIATAYSTISTTIGVLAGFTISMMAIIATSSNEKIANTKKYTIKTRKGDKDLIINNKAKTLFDILFTTLAWASFIEVFILITGIIVPLFFDCAWFLCLEVTLSIYVFVLILESVVHLWLSLT